MNKEQLKEELTPVFDELLSEKKKELEEIIPKRFVVESMKGPEDQVLEDSKGGFKSFGHYLKDVIRAGTEKALTPNLKAWDDAVRKTAGYMEEGDLSQGGYLVPEQFANMILARDLEDSIVRPRASIQPMQSNRITFAADVDADHSSSYFGGITVYRTAEGGQKSATNPTYQRIALTLHKLTGLCHVTDELLEDSFMAVEADIARKFKQTINFVQDDDFLNGTGVNQPLGALNSGNPCLVTVDAVGGQGAATIIAENIRDMWSRMHPQGQSKCVWLANIECFPQLFGMSVSVGTGGVPVWMPANSIAGQPYQTLMGRPLIYTEKCQALGTAGDIALCDFSQYKIGEKGGVQVATSIHFKFDYDEQSIRFVLRYDGQPTWTSALTPRRGSATLSPFIVLNGTRT